MHCGMSFCRQDEQKGLRAGGSTLTRVLHLAMKFSCRSCAPRRVLAWNGQQGKSGV